MLKLNALKFLLLVVAILRLVFWFLEQPAIATPVVDHHVEQGVFLVKQVVKDLDHYHVYKLSGILTRKLMYLRCFGRCLDFKLGERWQLRYRLYINKRFKQANSVATANWVKGEWNKRLATSVGVSRHDAYILSLQTWFEDSEVVAIFSALALNDKRFFTRQIWDVFKRTGTSHLVAMSGLHVGLAVGLLCRLLMTVFSFLYPRGFSLKIVYCRSFIVVALAGLLYFSVNFSYSIVRALMMYMGSMLPFLLSKHLSAKSLLWVVALLLVAIDPSVVLSIGACLSFFTVAVLLNYSSIEQSYEQIWFVSPLRCAVVFVFLLPMCLYFFHSASLVSPLVNMLVVPWFSLTVIPLLVLSFFASFVSACLGKMFAIGAWLFFEPAYRGLVWVSFWPHTQLEVNRFSLWGLVLCLAVLGLAALLSRHRYVNMRSL